MIGGLIVNIATMANSACQGSIIRNCNSDSGEHVRRARGELNFRQGRHRMGGRCLGSLGADQTVIGEPYVARGWDSGDTPACTGGLMLWIGSEGILGALRAIE